jgi:hypothetical protein
VSFEAPRGPTRLLLSRAGGARRLQSRTGPSPRGPENSVSSTSTRLFDGRSTHRVPADRRLCPQQGLEGHLTASFLFDGPPQGVTPCRQSGGHGPRRADGPGRPGVARRAGSAGAGGRMRLDGDDKRRCEGSNRRWLDATDLSPVPVRASDARNLPARSPQPPAHGRIHPRRDGPEDEPQDARDPRSGGLFRLVAGEGFEPSKA